MRYPSMNMEIYTVSAVLAHGSALYNSRSLPLPSHRMMQQLKTQAVQQEDAIFRAARCNCFLTHHPVVTYKDGNIRREEWFSNWGLLKMKANWRITPIWIVRI